jgi:nucleotidyltransferase/DNA polymerase involved in DNA repair
MPNSLPLSLHSFPRAILHVDGDAFFASCEQARNPCFKGKPLITGKERGIASSLSYEAKAMGVKRGMRLFEIKKLCPNVIILPSDYEHTASCPNGFLRSLSAIPVKWRNTASMNASLTSPE